MRWHHTERITVFNFDIPFTCMLRQRRKMNKWKSRMKQKKEPLIFFKGKRFLMVPLKNFCYRIRIFV